MIPGENRPIVLYRLSSMVYVPAVTVRKSIRGRPSLCRRCSVHMLHVHDCENSNK
jgi:hypothetical protein